LRKINEVVVSLRLYCVGRILYILVKNCKADSLTHAKWYGERNLYCQVFYLSDWM